MKTQEFYIEPSAKVINVCTAEVLCGSILSVPGPEKFEEGDENILIFQM